MKKDIHPQYFDQAKIICACKNVILVGTTREELHVEICSACHPFYTGKQKLIDTAGRVDKFKARQKKAQEVQAEKIAPKEVELVEEAVTKKKPAKPRKKKSE